MIIYINLCMYVINVIVPGEIGLCINGEEIVCPDNYNAHQYVDPLIDYLWFGRKQTSGVLM